MGLEDITHAPDALTNRILDDANRAQQKISAFLPDTYHYEDHRGVYVQPKVTTTVNATKGALAIANLSGSAAWMNGCTCQLTGSTVFNRLRKNQSTGAFELARPYLGTTGTGIAITIWHDSVQLPTDVLRIKGPFKFNADPMRATDASSLRALMGDTRNQGDPDMFAEISTHGGDESPFMAMLLNQLPAGDAEISYTAVGKVANFTSLSDTRVSTVPFNMEASILFPIFSYYLSGFPLFEGSKEELGSEYQEAIMALQRMPRQSSPKYVLRPKR